MNSTDFTYLLEHPETITPQQTQDVKEVLKEFPYFQSARALYLKGLKNENSYKYNQELKTTAACTTDRSILFDFITSETFLQNEVSEYIKQNIERLKDIDVIAEDISVNKSVNIDLLLKQQIKDTEGVLDPSLFQPIVAPEKIVSFELNQNEQIEEATETTKTQEASAQDILELGKPLQFDKTETHSFNEWLKLTRFKPIERQEVEIAVEEEKATTDRERKFELINKFINENPKIDPTKSTAAKGNIAKQQMIQPEALMTETLARIYVEQKNFKKAIQSYKILSLKYPEKSGFFADQIKAVEQLQEQNKKE